MSQTTSQAPKAVSFVQNPRLLMLVNDKLVENPISAEWTNNNYTEAGTFSVQFCVNQTEAQMLMSANAISVEIQVTTNGGAWQSMMFGYADAVELDPISLHCDLTGRDLIALFVDTSSAGVAQNVPAADVIANICLSHVNQGLKAQIANNSQSVAASSSYGPALGARAKANTATSLTAKTKLVGRNYGSDYKHVKESGSEWELMLALAQGLGYDLRIGGPDQNGNLLDAKTLYFGPPPASESAAFVLAINYGPPIQANVETVTINRKLTLSGKITVVGYGWNSSLGKSIGAQVSGNPQGTGQGGPPKNQVYYVRLPGDLTQQQANDFVQAKLAQITAFERDLHITMPGELTLTPSNLIKLTGTSTDADQDYFIDEISRSISFESGFTETIRCKNHSPYLVGEVEPTPFVQQEVEPVENTP